MIGIEYAPVLPAADLDAEMYFSRYSFGGADLVSRSYFELADRMASIRFATNAVVIETDFFRRQGRPEFTPE